MTDAEASTQVSVRCVDRPHESTTPSSPTDGAASWPIQTANLRGCAFRRGQTPLCSWSLLGSGGSYRIQPKGRYVPGWLLRGRHADLAPTLGNRHRRDRVSPGSGLSGHPDRAVIFEARLGA